jgi:3',5'-cyclic AMP phosphodiesterase CpdA
MVRLVHLSDIHLTVPNLEWRREDWFNKRMAAWLNFRCLGRGMRFRHADQVLTRLMDDNAQRGIDHVIFSGDATALGFASELQHAAQALQVNTLAGLAVPGNHDYCTIPAAASGNIERVFAPWQQGRRIGQETYPFAQRVGSIWLIGVNTATGNRWAWDAGGAAGATQRERLGQLLKELEPAPRILVTHYPICLKNGKVERRTHGLRDMRELVDVAAKGGVSLWLHGHRHGFYYLPRSPFAPFPVLCGGSSTQTGLWTHCEYTVDGNQFEVLRRVYNPGKNMFEDVDRFALQLDV